MNGIVALLPAEYSEQVEEVWRDLEQEFRVSFVAKRVPFAHFSYHVAAEYDLEVLENALSRLVQGWQPITVRTSGLGIFANADDLVLYIAVTRPPALSRFHAALWVAPIGATGASAYYAPDAWMPHITLAQRDLTPDLLGHIVRRLSTRRLDWELSVDHVALLVDPGGGAPHECRLHLSFGGA